MKLKSRSEIVYFLYVIHQSLEVTSIYLQQKICMAARIMASFLSHVVNKRKNKTKKYNLLLPNVSEKMIAYHQRILDCFCHCVTQEKFTFY